MSSLRTGGRGTRQLVLQVRGFFHSVLTGENFSKLTMRAKAKVMFEYTLLLCGKCMAVVLTLRALFLLRNCLVFALLVPNPSRGAMLSTTLPSSP